MTPRAPSPPSFVGWVDVQEVRTHLWVETQRQWDLAIARYGPIRLSEVSSPGPPWPPTRCRFPTQGGLLTLDAIALRRHLWLGGRRPRATTAIVDSLLTPLALQLGRRRNTPLRLWLYNFNELHDPEDTLQGDTPDTGEHECN